MTDLQTKAQTTNFKAYICFDCQRTVPGEQVEHTDGSLICPECGHVNQPGQEFIPLNELQVKAQALTKLEAERELVRLWGLEEISREIVNSVKLSEKKEFELDTTMFFKAFRRLLTVLKPQPPKETPCTTKP